MPQHTPSPSICSCLYVVASNVGRCRSLILIFTLLLGIGSMMSCKGKDEVEYNDAFYAKALTIKLLPKDVNTSKTPLSQLPYYQFQLNRGYLSNKSTEYSSFEFNALYPGMSHFSRSNQETWFPEGRDKPINPDRLRIFVEFRLAGGNDEGLEVARFVERQVKDGKFEIETNSNQVEKVTKLRTFRNAERKSSKYYIFVQQDGRIVAVKCDLGCTGHTTWEGKIRIHYIFPEARLSEMVDVDLAVNRLVNSFMPTLIKMGEQ